MKEFSLIFSIFCLLGCVPNLQNQPAINPSSEGKTVKEIADTQECERLTLSADNTDAPDSIVDDKPSKIVTATMAGVWGGAFIANISLPFAAVVLPIADLESGEDSYSQKLKDKFTKQADAVNHCEPK
jgi:hypothetical protein